MRLPATESTLRRALRGPCALPGGATLVAAVSGGADSTALAVALARLAPEFGLRVVIAHLDHGVRGAESAADAAHVRALAARLRLPCVTARLREGVASSEAALRERRRRFLHRAARCTGAAAMATAHTADDQLETLLLRLGRGTGLTGLASMRPRRGRWLKPLLGLTRLAIERDLRAAGRAWREDSTNGDRAHARNRVRHDALPALLAALTPAAEPHAARARLAIRTASLLAELAGTDALIEQLAEAALARTSLGEALSLRAWRAEPAPLRRRMLRLWWRLRLGRARPSLTAQHLDMLEQVARSGRGGARVALPAGHWAQIRAGRLVLQSGGGPRSGPGRRRPEASVPA